MDEISGGSGASDGFWVTPPIPTPPPLATPESLSSFGASEAPAPVLSSFGATEILADPGVGVRPPRRRTAVVASVAALSVALVAGGAFAAYTTLSGGGSQPEDVLPATTVALLKVDLDPSASQKVALFQLLQKFPNASGLKDTDKTFGDWLSRRLSESAGTSDVNYERDIKPWLGQRFAIADLPDSSGKKADVILVLQETDEKAAAAGLDTIKKAGGATTFDYAFADGYVLVSSSADGAHKAVEAAKSANLASSEQFAGDIAALGSDEIVTGWADAKKVGEQLTSLIDAASSLSGLGGGLAGTDTSKLIAANYQGRFVLGVHATSDSVELKTLVRGAASKPAVAPVTALSSVLPGAWAVIDVTGIDTAINNGWASVATLPQLSSSIAQLKDQFGIELPGDLTAILGKELAVSAAGELTAPQILAAAKTADGAKAQAALLKLLDAVGVDPGMVPQRLDGNTLYLGSTEAALAGAGKGSITSDPLFQQAVADPDQAQAVVFVDLTKVWKALADQGSSSADSLAEAQHIAAVGFSANSSSVVVRVIFK